MNLATLGFLVLIVLVSGGIGVLADWLGRRVGKKKLTIATWWGKLRPKTTAQVFTFTSGVLVSTFTILLVYAASSDVRLWIRKGSELVRDLQLLQSELKQTRAANDATKAENASLRLQSKTLRASIDSNRRAIAQLQSTSEQLRTRNDQLRQQADSAQSRLAAANSRLSAIQARLTSVQSRLASAATSLKQIKSDLVANQQKLGQSQKRLAVALKAEGAAKDQFAVAAQQLKEAREESLRLDFEKQGLEREVSSLQSQRQDLRAELDATKKEKTEAEEDLIAKQNDLSKAIIELAQLQAELQEARNAVMVQNVTMARSRVQPLTFGVGEEIVRVPVEDNLSPQEARNALSTLVRAARTVATDRGAEGRGQQFPVAGIFERRDAQGHVFSTEELENRLASEISGKPYAQLLVAAASINSYKGEPVSLEVLVYPNPLVFKESEVIAEGRIDGTRDPALIYSQLTGFIRSNLRERAEQSKMILKQGREDTLGQIPMGEIVSLVNRIRVADRTVRLQAVASGDTHAGDPLRVEFRLK